MDIVSMLSNKERSNLMKSLQEQLDEHFINESELISDGELEALTGGLNHDSKSEPQSE